MNSSIKRIVAAGLAFLSVAGLVACQGSNTSEDVTVADTHNETQAETQAETVKEPSFTFSPTFVKEPLTGLIFGSRSYMQGDNFIGEIPPEALPSTFLSPMSMTLASFEDWQKFYGGVPRHSVMDDDFVTALAGIDESFFKTKCLIAVFVYEKSPLYTHEVTEVTPHEGTLRVSITTHVKENATQENAFRCILIPVTRDYASLSIKVSITKESN